MLDLLTVVALDLQAAAESSRRLADRGNSSRACVPA